MKSHYCDFISSSLVEVGRESKREKKRESESVRATRKSNQVAKTQTIKENSEESH